MFYILPSSDYNLFKLYIGSTYNNNIIAIYPKNISVIFTKTWTLICTYVVMDRVPEIVFSYICMELAEKWV